MLASGKVPMLLHLLMAAVQMQLWVLLILFGDAQPQEFGNQIAVVFTTAFVSSSPSLLRYMRGIPRMARRYWSERLDDGTGVEVSKGVWENIIMSRAVHMSMRSLLDVSDKYYMLLFRMPQAAFEHLYDLYGYRMAKQDTNYRSSIPGKKRMAIFLTYLAHGHKQEQLRLLYDVSQSVVSKIIRQGLLVFLEFMVAAEITVPVGQELLGVEAGFRSLAGMRGCIGAVDGSFFHINQPSGWGEAYWCYKHIYAILLLAIVDANMVFRWIHAGGPGSVGDASVWNKSDYKQHLLGGAFDLPQPHVMHGTSIQSYVVADTAFALHSRVIKCFDIAQLASEKALNAAVIRTRRIVENAFGFLKGRWNICVFNRISDAEEARDVCMVCCALHNFCQRHSLHFDPEWSGHFTSIEHASTADVNAYRDARRRHNRHPQSRQPPDAAAEVVRMALSQHALQSASQPRYATVGMKRSALQLS